jgi:hypothetical protein
VKAAAGADRQRAFADEVVSGDFACLVAREAEGGGHRRAEQRIAERVEDQRERVLGHVMLLVADGELGNQPADRIEDRVERVAIAGQDHPCGQRAGAFPVEHVEGAVDDLARVGLPCAGLLDRLGDARGDGLGDRPRKLALKPGGGAEMVQQIGMGAADLGGDGLQRDRLRPGRKQEPPSGRDCGRAALFGAQSLSAC